MTLLHFKILAAMVSILWALELVDTVLLRGALNRFGIRPRQQRGINGILFAPLLHGDLGHLAANTVPLVVLSGLILLSGVQVFVITTVVVWLVSGWGVWLFGRSRSNHIGASGVVFGYLGFLLARGYFEQSGGAVAIALITGLLYGGSLWGVLPFQRGKSWEGHLFGLLGGGLAAYWLPQFTEWLLRVDTSAVFTPVIFMTARFTT